MSIRIDHESGAIVGASFVIVTGLKRSALRRIQPDVFRPLDGPFTLVAKDEFDGYVFSVFAFDRGEGIEAYELTADWDGDGWDSWTKEGEEDRCRTYHAILAASGVGDKEQLPWGHATVAYDFKNGTHSLWVAHCAEHDSPP